jgi:integrase
MPADQRGEPRRLADGRYTLRYRDRDGARHNTAEKFPNRTAALRHYRDVIEPRLRGGAVQRRALTLDELVDLYLERHAVHVRPRTIRTLEDRLRHARAAFGNESLEELERMADEIAGWQATLPPRAGHGIAQALRQVLAAGVRWGHLQTNPAKLAGPNPKPPRRAVRAFTHAEIAAISAELHPRWRPLPGFAAATGLRPEEWQALERRDVDLRAGVLHVRRSVSSGQVVELGKTTRSRRQVPLSPRALDALEQIPARLDTPLLFSAERGGLLNLDDFRRREWTPAIEAAAIAKPARVYDLRSTFASNAIAAGVDTFTLARFMGTSSAMIEDHYGVLLPGAAADFAHRLAAFEAAQSDAAAGGS